MVLTTVTRSLGNLFIALDLDGVIADQCNELYKRIATKVENPVHYSEWDTYHLEEIHPELGDWVGEQFSDPSFYAALEPFEDAVRWIRDHKNDSVNIVTARPEHVRDVTLKWFKAHRIPYDNVYMMPRMEKADFLHVLKPDFMVEDDPRNAEHIASVGHKCYLINRSYNLNFDAGKAVRIDRLDDVDE